jgi:serine/threonine protein kinase
MHGLKDHSARYADLATQAAAHGFSVYAFDLRGHGRSAGPRVAPDRWTDYVDDLDRFLTRVQQREPGKPVFLFGHSMGGAIAARAAEVHGAGGWNGAAGANRSSGGAGIANGGAQGGAGVANGGAQGGAGVANGGAQGGAGVANGEAQGGAGVANAGASAPIAGLILSGPALAIDPPPLLIAATRMTGALMPRFPALDLKNGDFSSDPAAKAAMNRDELILQPIASGGMGEVFLAEHWLIKRRFAMKVLRSEYATDATMIRRFMNEALAAGTLGHPNIVESTDMGFTKADVPYIVFEYVEGRSLASEIDTHGAFAVPRALRIAYQIASALEAAHQADIIHRDLKAENILLLQKPDHPDHVKVIDFGISRFMHASDKTAVGSTLTGTPEYMAPEQILTPDAIDRRCDIYALGVVLYEMLAGHVPFALPPGAKLLLDMDTAHALLSRILQEPPPPFHRPDAPPGLVEMVCDKLLAKSPSDRYQSMKQVQRALDAFATVLPTRTDLAAWKPADTTATVDDNALAAAARAAAMADALSVRPRFDIEHPRLRMTIPNQPATRRASRSTRTSSPCCSRASTCRAPRRSRGGSRHRASARRRTDDR